MLIAFHALSKLQPRSGPLVIHVKERHRYGRYGRTCSTSRLTILPARTNGANVSSLSKSASRIYHNLISWFAPTFSRQSGQEPPPTHVLCRRVCFAPELLGLRDRQTWKLVLQSHVSHSSPNASGLAHECARPFLGPNLPIEQVEVYSVDILQIVSFTLHSTHLDQVAWASSYGAFGEACHHHLSISPYSGSLNPVTMTTLSTHKGIY